jgi:hypothetical protein
MRRGGADMDEVAEDGRSRLISMRDTVVRGLVIFSRIADPDAKFRAGLRGSWGFSVVNEAIESYGYNSPWLKHVASPAEITEMEVVLEWIGWLRREPTEGEGAVKRIIAWASGTPMRVLSWREQCSERTIFNRIDSSISKILLEFEAIAVEVENLDEPPVEERRPTCFTERPSKAGSPDSLEPGKVWIAGVGFMFRGARYDPYGKALDRMSRRQLRAR